MCADVKKPRIPRAAGGISGPYELPESSSGADPFPEIPLFDETGNLTEEGRRLAEKNGFLIEGVGRGLMGTLKE